MIRFASLFSQLVAIFDRSRFHKLVAEHRAERHAKGFSCWDQFVAMLFCQLAQAKSLREICRRPGLLQRQGAALGGATGTEEVHPELRQRPSALAAFSRPVLRDAGPCARRRPEASVSFQKQAVVA